MTTTAQQLSQGSLRLRTAAAQAANPEAWKSMVGTKPVSARFDLLPNTKPRMGALGTSLIIQIALAAFLVIVPLLFPQQMIPRSMYMVTDLAGPPLDIPNAATAETSCRRQGQGATASTSGRATRSEAGCG